MADAFEAAAAEAEGGRYVEAFGNRYEVARKIAAMPMLKFSKLAAKGVTTGDAESGAAMYDVLRAMFTKEAWARFEDDATETGADNDELFAVVAQAIEVINGFPTSSSSASASTPSSTTPSSTVSSFADRKRELGMTKVTPESLAALVG
jgi:hypothetical protein